jgi:hypothetical protein
VLEGGGRSAKTIGRSNKTPFQRRSNRLVLICNPSAEIRYRLGIRAFYEFNIANLSLATNTVIRHAIVEARIDSVTDSPNLPNFPNFPNFPVFCPSSAM